MMIPLDAIRRAREILDGVATRTPLVRLTAPDSPGEIYLKLENLQPIGSFKIRGAYNAIFQASPESRARGVVTASAGNMAQGVAFAARLLGLEATVIVPESAPQTKVAAVERLGGKVVKVSYDRWWQSIQESRFDEVSGLFVHPVLDDPVMAGNGTIGLEVLEDLPRPSTILIPWGGGGLASGIASAVRALAPQTKIFAVEVETAAPLTASWKAGSPQAIVPQPSFVDGIGGKSVLPKMWPLAQELLDGVLTVSLEEVASAVRFLAERARVIAEGAGAAPVALALSGRAGGGKIVCVVSGGNIDFSRLAPILLGRESTPL